MAAIELDYIKDLLAKIHTTATVAHQSELGNIVHINDTSRLFIHTGEIVGVDENSGIIIKWYDVEMYEVSEILTMAALNNIINGIKKMNARTAITSYTKPAILISGRFIKSTRQYHHNATGHWTCKITLQFKWSTI